MTDTDDTANRPFRDLCPEADERDQMIDEEFWVRVTERLTSTIDYEFVFDGLESEPCTVCGSLSACMYDSMGRALIHTTNDDDNEGDGIHYD